MNQSGKRQSVIIVLERNGSFVLAMFGSESAALGFIRKRIQLSSIVHAYEASSWDALHARCGMKRINHQQAYSTDGACTNMAEDYFSRLRRAEMGHHHHIAGVCLLRYAQEASRREDHRREANGAQYQRIAGAAMKRGPSVDFCGYWQRHIKPAA